MSKPTYEELEQHCRELAGKVRFLLDYGDHWGEDGMFCFPDGDI